LIHVEPFLSSFIGSYGNPVVAEPDDKSFAEDFLNNHACRILDAYLQKVIIPLSFGNSNLPCNSSNIKAGCHSPGRRNEPSAFGADFTLFF